MKPMDLILDTDAGSDCDDMMALAYLLSAERRGLVRLRAITCSNGCADSIPAIRTFLRYYGRERVPIGRPSGEVRTYDHYCRAICERFSHAEDHLPAEDAVTVLRRALCDSERAVLCGIGPLTNLAALLESPPDEASPLDGASLVRGKCERIVLMAGTFAEDAARRAPEWNAKLDAAATKAVAEKSPVPLVFLPFETGENMLTGGSVMRRYDDGDPLALSFRRFPGAEKMGGRHSWDPVTVLYAVEGCGAYLDDALCGTVTVDEEGRTILKEHPNGQHRVIRVKERDKAVVAAYLDTLAQELCAAASRTSLRDGKGNDDEK